MPQTRKTPAGKAVASRDDSEGWARFMDRLEVGQSQFLMLAIRFGPEIIVFLAILANGGAQ